MLKGQSQGNNTTNESQEMEGAELHSNSAAPKEASPGNSDKTLPSPAPARPLAQPASAAINRVPKNAWLYLFTFLNYHDVYRGVGFVSKEWRRFSEDSIVENALYHHWQTKCREHPEFQDTSSLTHFLLPDKEVDEKELKVDRYFAQRLDNRPIPIGVNMSIDVLVETFQEIKQFVIPNWTGWPGHISRVQQQFYSTLTPQQLRKRIESLFTKAKRLRQDYHSYFEELASLTSASLTPELSTDTALVPATQPLQEQFSNMHLQASTNAAEEKHSRPAKLDLEGYVELHKFFTETREVIHILSDMLIVIKMAGLLVNQDGLNPAGLPHVLQMLKDPNWTSYMTGKAILVMANFRLFFFGEFFKHENLSQLVEKLTPTEMLFVSRYNSSPDDSIQLATLASLIALPFVRSKFTEQEFIRFAHYSYDDHNTISGERATILLSNEKVTTSFSLSDESLIALMSKTSIKDVSRPDMDQWAEIKEILAKNPTLKDHMAADGGELWLKLVLSSTRHDEFIVQAPEVHERIAATKLIQIILKSQGNADVYFAQSKSIDKFQKALTPEQLEKLIDACDEPLQSKLRRELHPRVERSEPRLKYPPHRYLPAQRRGLTESQRQPRSHTQQRVEQEQANQPSFILVVEPSISTPTMTESQPPTKDTVKVEKSSSWTWRKIGTLIGLALLLLLSLALIAGGSTALAGVELLFITKTVAWWVLGSGVLGLVLTGVLGWFGVGPSKPLDISAFTPAEETTVTPPSYSITTSRTSISSTPQPECLDTPTMSGEHYALASSSSSSSSIASAATTSPTLSVPSRPTPEDLGYGVKIPTLS